MLTVLSRGRRSPKPAPPIFNTERQPPNLESAGTVEVARLKHTHSVASDANGEKLTHGPIRRDWAGRRADLVALRGVEMQPV